MSSIPEKFRKYYDEFSSDDAINYTGANNEQELFELYSAQNCKNLKVTHLGWAMVKEDYIEVLSELGLEFVEVLKDEKEQVFLGYLSGEVLHKVKLSLLEEFFV